LSYADVGIAELPKAEKKQKAQRPVGIRRNARGSDGLTPKQKRFVDEYVVDLNGTQAAKRAGLKASTDGATRVAASSLLADPNVSKAVAIKIEERAMRTQITQDRVLEELARIAFGDPREVMSWGPNGVRLLDSDKLDAAAAAMVSEVSESRGPNGLSVSIKLRDRIRALDMLRDHLGMRTKPEAVVNVNVLVAPEERSTILERVREKIGGIAPSKQGAVLEHAG